MMSINCPVCNHDDSIQKVSIIVANGRSSRTISGPTEGVAYNVEKWESVGGVIAISRNASIELARKLSPPIEPRNKGGIGCKGIWAIVLTFILFVFSIGFVTIILRNLGQLNNLSSISSLILAGLMPIIFAVVIGGYLFIFLPIKGIFMVWDQYKVSKLKEGEKYIKEKLRWDAAINKWNCSYYCHRDGVVFDNNGITVCQLEQFSEFLFS
jgi:hypothetical protein